MIEEKIAELYFFLKEHKKIESNSKKEQKLYDLLEKHKKELKEFAQETEEDSETEKV